MKLPMTSKLFLVGLIINVKFIYGTPPVFNAPVGGTRPNFANSFNTGKVEWLRYCPRSAVLWMSQYHCCYTGFMIVLFSNAKVSRIFAANLLLKAATASGNGWTRDVMDNVYLVTSDADLWPISSSIYDLPDGVDVLSLNAFCCGMFKHGTSMHQMVPMANVGARIATWRNLTHRWFGPI